MPLEGLDEVLFALDEVPERIMDGAEEGMRHGIQRVEAQAKKTAPVDTGELRQKIMRNVYRGFGGIEAHVKAYAEHAPYVEFGTGPNGKASGGKGSAYRTTGWVYPVDKHKNGIHKFAFTMGQPARPYLYPALKENESKIAGDIAKAIKKALRT